MRVQWSDEKIHITTNKAIKQKAKREAAFINNKNACPLCFDTDLKVIIANKTPECEEGEVKFTAICKSCQVKVYYYKRIEEI